MLGRYVAGTLLILGAAMLLAPPPETREADTAEGVAGAGTGAAAAAPVAAGPARDAAAEAADESGVIAGGVVAAPEMGGEGSAPPGRLAEVHERLVRARLDAPGTGDAGGTPAAGTPAWDARTAAATGTAMGGIARQAAAVPTLSQPATLRAAPFPHGPRAARAIAPDRASDPQAPPITTAATSPDAMGPDATGPDVGAAGDADGGDADGGEADGGGVAPDTRLVVTGSRVNVRAGPSTDHGIVTSLPRGAEVALVAYEGPAWARVRFEGGREGFMSRRYLGPGATARDGG